MGIQLYQCAACGSFNVSIEAIVKQDLETGILYIVDECEKGHACDDCGGNDIKTVVAARTFSPKLPE